jgi:hypothetical protein
VTGRLRASGRVAGDQRVPAYRAHLRAAEIVMTAAAGEDPRGHPGDRQALYIDQHRVADRCRRQEYFKA